LSADKLVGGQVVGGRLVGGQVGIGRVVGGQVVGGQVVGGRVVGGQVAIVPFCIFYGWYILHVGTLCQEKSGNPEFGATEKLSFCVFIATRSI
jgi:hypothetical protein